MAEKGIPDFMREFDMNIDYGLTPVSYKPDEKTDRDNDGIEEVRCSAIKSNGKRCGNRTENKNGK